MNKKNQKLTESTLVRTIVLDYDLIEIHYNPILKNNPYLVKIFSYNNPDPYFLRLNKKDIKNLFKILQKHKLL